MLIQGLCPVPVTYAMNYAVHRTSRFEVTKQFPTCMCSILLYYESHRNVTYRRCSVGLRVRLFVCSDGSFFRQIFVPKAHCSEVLLLRKPFSPTSRFSENKIRRNYPYLIFEEKPVGVMNCRSSDLRMTHISDQCLLKSTKVH